MQSISPMEQSVLPLTIGLKVVVQALLGHEQKTVSGKHLRLQLSSSRHQWFHRPQNIFNYSHMQITHRNRITDKCLILGRIPLPSSLLLSHLLSVLFSQVLHSMKMQWDKDVGKNDSWLKLHLVFGLWDLLCLCRPDLLGLALCCWPAELFITTQGRHLSCYPWVSCWDSAALTFLCREFSWKSKLFSLEDTLWVQCLSCGTVLPQGTQLFDFTVAK